MQNDFMQSLTDSITPKFAVSYLRVSTRDQAERGGGADEGFSIPAQRDANKKKALSMGAIVGKEFVDRGASARSAHRPELQKMLEYIRENKDRVDYVIVHKVDRLARNRGDDIDITRVLQEADVQLVSASENIDNTPSGILLHGIMSSIAEFYSRNLATEVIKGMRGKVDKGGTPTKAPIGYKNIRDHDELGRRNSRVEVDVERAPLIKLAFEEYATGKWSLSGLAEHMSELGLATPPTPKLPSKQPNKKMLHYILMNSYYKGIVTYNGVKYPGKHSAIVDEATWDKVQEVLRSHVNGERVRIHEHYLKSTVYCGKCGARLIIHNAKSRSGDRYPYFVCSAKHNKRNDCKQRSLLIEEIEIKIEELYKQLSFSSQFRELAQKWFDSQVAKLEQEGKIQIDRLEKQKAKLEREQVKLLQAHYAEAVSLDLLKTEQERIGRALKGITSQMATYQAEYSITSANLSAALTLLDNCGRAYKLAGDYERRCFNQAVFNRIFVSDDGITLESDYNEPFDILLDPHILALKSEYEKKKSNEQPEAAAHLAMPNSLDSIKTKTTSIFFTGGLSKNHLMRLRGLEPPCPYEHSDLNAACLPVPP